MTEPIVKELINGYMLTWPSYRVAITCSKLKEHSDGHISGMLFIMLGDRRVFPDSQFNFSAPGTRNQVIKQLTETTPDVNWQVVIYQACQMMHDIKKQGESVSELWPTGDDVELSWLLEPLLVKGLPTVIFGEKGVAKSTLALLCYVCLTLPWAENPFGFTLPSQSIPTLDLDWELPGEIAQRNLRHLMNGMELPALPLLHRRCRRPRVDDIEHIAYHIDKHQAQVVIIDSLARACGHDLIKTEPANEFFDALDQLNVTSLIIAQTSKDVESKHKTIYGNALFTYYARSIWELCKSEQIDENKVNVGLFHRWANLTRLYPDMGFELCFNGHSMTVERVPVSVAEFTGKVRMATAIREHLKSGAMSAKELAEAIGTSENTIRVALTKLKKKNIVLNVEHGTCGLRSDQY